MAKQILLLENDEEAKSVLATHLQEAGYGVICPIDGYVGLEIAGDTPPDLILLNADMPIINGPDFLEAIRSEGINAPAIIFIQTRTQEEIPNFDTLSPCSIVQKPFQIEALLKQVATLINN